VLRVGFKSHRFIVKSSPFETIAIMSFEEQVIEEAAATIPDAGPVINWSDIKVSF